MRVLCVVGFCLLLLPCPVRAGAVFDAAGYDAAVLAGQGRQTEITLSGTAPVVFPARPLPVDVGRLTISTSGGPALLKGGDINGRLLHTTAEETFLDFTGSAPIALCDFIHQGKDNTDKEGWGGVFYTGNSLILNSSNALIFHGNRAQGGQSSGGSSSRSSGQGGAFCVDGTLEAGGAGPFLFFGNGAQAGSGVAVGNSGQGGAIYAEKGLHLMSGSWNFTGNLAQAADALSPPASARNSGYGGAVDSTYDLVLAPQGSYLFIGNRAMGGKAAPGGDCDASGQGGAVYCVSGVEIHNGVFLFNRADTANAGDMSSGVGGGIYHEAYGNDHTIRLRADRGRPVFFAGNTHNPGGTGSELNSLYFGNTGNTHVSHTTFVVDCDTDAVAVLLDPIAGQADGASGVQGTLMDIAVSVQKVGPGLWILGGHNRMAGPTEWRVEQGTLRLTRDAFGGPSHIALTSKLAGDFLLAENAALEITPWEVPARITAGAIELAAGSVVRLVDAPYRAALRTDAPVVLLRLETPVGMPIVQARLPETSGTISLGDKQYAYRDLAWQTDGNTAELTCMFSEADTTSAANK